MKREKRGAATIRERQSRTPVVAETPRGRPTRLAVYVSPELFRRAKIAAATRGTTLSALVTEGLEAILPSRDTT